MKIKLITFFVCIAFILNAQEKFNVELTTGIVGVKYSSKGNLNILEQDSRLGYIHGIGISAFLNEIWYLKTELGTLAIDKTIDVEVGTNVPGSTIRRFGWLDLSENFFALELGAKVPKFGLFGEIGLATINVANQTFDEPGTLMHSNYSAALFSIGWKRAFMGIDDNLGVMVNAKYIKTFGSLLESVPVAHLEQDLVSFNIGLHYVFRGSREVLN